MKKLISVIIAASFYSNIAMSQEVPLPVNNKKEIGEERLQKMSFKHRQKMEERRKEFESLSPEKREEVKREMKRHREEMKRITGKDLPLPPHPDFESGRDAKK